MVVGIAEIRRLSNNFKNSLKNNNTSLPKTSTVFMMIVFHIEEFAETL